MSKVMLVLKRVLAGVVLLCGARLRGESLLWDRSTPDALRRAVLVDASDFSRDYLVKLSRRILAKGHDWKLVDVQFLTRIDHPTRFARFFHAPFEVWQKDYQEAQQMHWQAAQLIGFDGRAVLRVRDGKQFARILIRGATDPLKWNVAGVSYEIVHIAFGTGLFPIEVFAQASTLDVASCREFLRLLQKQIGIRLPYLACRRDLWFFGNHKFPAYYLFGEFRFPSTTEYDTAPEVVCADYSRGLECQGARLP